MTLLELLAALVLASLLMAGVVGVLRQMKLKTRQLEELEGEPAWKQQFVALVTHDLQSARRISVDETSITLTGYMGRNFNTGAATHRPTQVRYFVRQSEDQAWLMRREEHIDVRSTENSQTEVVCSGIRSLSIERIEEGALGLRTRLRQASSQVFVKIPARLRVTLYDQPIPSPEFTPVVEAEVFLR